MWIWLICLRVRTDCNEHSVSVKVGVFSSYYQLLRNYAAPLCPLCICFHMWKGPLLKYCRCLSKHCTGTCLHETAYLWAVDSCFTSHKVLEFITVFTECHYYTTSKKLSIEGICIIMTNLCLAVLQRKFLEKFDIIGFEFHIRSVDCEYRQMWNCPRSI